MNLLKNKIVHCKNETEAKKLMQNAEDEGYKWANESKPTKHTYFDSYFNVLYFFDYFYDGKITFREVVDLHEEGLDIIEFSDLFPSYEQQETRVTKHNTTLGEKILVKNYEDDDWQERYFLIESNGYIYATEEENGEFATAWKYGIKKEVK